MQRIFFQVIALTIPILVLLAYTLKLSDGSFTYTLDDPYIHLALAKNIWQGHYGINALEPSAPSSSIIWPFLLAPFASFAAIFEFMPLVFNIACAITSGIVLINIFKNLNTIAATLLACFIMLSMNVYGLIFTGLEHSLQVLLILCISYHLLHNDVNEEFSSSNLLFYACLVLLPLVRYEGLAISLPVLAYSFLKGNYKFSIATFLLIVLALTSFSLFLYVHDLGFLPSSVLAKSSHASASSTADNFLSNLKKYGYFLIPIGMICIHKFQKDAPFAILLLLVAALHFVFGRHGWFGRYEIYFIIFITVISFKLLTDLNPKMWMLAFILPLPLAHLIKITYDTPLAAANIHNQQVQMGEIASILDEPLAVNDLGVVALRSNQYVLDLAGLGSLEALKHIQKSGTDPKWISELMAKKKVSQVMLYVEWYPKQPAHWIKVAELKLTQKRITPASDTVTFFSTSEEAAARMRLALDKFSKMDRPGHYLLKMNNPS